MTTNTESKQLKRKINQEKKEENHFFLFLLLLIIPVLLSIEQKFQLQFNL